MKKGSKNIDLYEKKKVEVSDELNKTVRSQLRASEKYDKENVDSIRLRVPAGWKEKMQIHAKESSYASLNAMLVELIRKECNIEEK